MVKDNSLINVKCPMCETTLVSVEKCEEVKGPFQHKCGKCKRFWRVDYTTRIVKHVKGKNDSTPIKIWLLNLETGDSTTLIY